MIQKDPAARTFKSAREAHATLTSYGLMSQRGLPNLQASQVPEPTAVQTRDETAVPLRLKIWIGGEVQVFSFPPDRPVLVGRSGVCHVRPDRDAVSDKHALFAHRPDGWWLYDLASTGGTMVNRKPVTAVALNHGDIIEFAGHACKVSLDPAAGAAPVDSAKPRVFGNFRLIEQIHEGRNGQLFKADRLDKPDRDPVALRILPAAFQLDEVQIRRFLRGIPDAARFRHPNLVRLYKGGNVLKDDGRRIWFLAMEYLAGGSLRDRVKGGRSQSVADVVRIGLDIAAGIQAIAAEGRIHRGIQPACVLFDEQDRAKLGDFFLLRAEVLDTLNQVTHGAPPVGEHAYQAPETLRPGGTASTTADVYSLAAVLYEAATGRPPFAARQAPAGNDPPHPTRPGGAADRREPGVAEGPERPVGAVPGEEPGRPVAERRDVRGGAAGVSVTTLASRERERPVFAPAQSFVLAQTPVAHQYFQRGGSRPTDGRRSRPPGTAGILPAAALDASRASPWAASARAGRMPAVPGGRLRRPLKVLSHSRLALRSSHEPIDGQSPSRHRRLRVHLRPGSEHRRGDLAGPPPPDLPGDGIDVPDHARPRLEVLGPLGGHLLLGGRPVVVLAPHLGREVGRPGHEPHRIGRRRSGVVRGVGRERLPPRREQRHRETHVVAERRPAAGRVRMVGQPAGDPQGDHPGSVAGGRERDDLAVDEFGLAFDLGEVGECSPGGRDHGRHAGHSGAGWATASPYRNRRERSADNVTRHSFRRGLRTAAGRRRVRRSRYC